MRHSDVKLIVRADDMGSSWASNEGCIKACLNGIATCVEVMMPCAWVLDAAQKLKINPGIDVGIHLTLTSEWDRFKWRPLTTASSLIDNNGNFFPLLVPQAGDDRPVLQNQNWKIEDIRTELEAQIEMGLRLFPQTSHISSHMIEHFRSFHAELDEVISNLCQKFALTNDPLGGEIPLLRPYPKHPIKTDAREMAFIDILKGLDSGTYIVVDHPAANSPEMNAIGHEGYWDVGQDRSTCLEVFLSSRVKTEIDQLGIELISYRDL